MWKLTDTVATPSPEDSCLSPGVYGAFAISEAFLYRTKVPEYELYALTQFQEWMKRQNGNVIVTDGPSVEESDSNYYVRNSKDGIVYCIYAWANSSYYHILQPTVSSQYYSPW